MISNANSKERINVIKPKLKYFNCLEKNVDFILSIKRISIRFQNKRKYCWGRSKRCNF